MSAGRMLTAPARPALPGALLRLGRVSNLPTVWTDVAAGTLLAGGVLSGQTAVVLAAATTLYVGGMYLNDACDHRIDRVERPGRPIPAGIVSCRSVAVTGSLLLAAGVLLLASLGVAAGVCGGLLAALIVAYDLHHKGNRFSPVLMGGCRALVYLAASCAVTPEPGWPVAIGGICAMAHVAGLTYAARNEASDRIGRIWPLAVLAVPFALPFLLPGSPGPVWLAAAALACADGTALRWLRQRRRPVSAAVALLIASVSLVDGLAMAGQAGWAGLWIGAAGFGLTLLFQRAIPGT